jgi:hypothetical protein
VNVREAILVADQLVNMGFTPFIPHLSHFWHLLKPRPYGDWTRLDFDWLPKCDVLLRLSGESSGADAEVKRAMELGIPVVHDLDEMPLSERESELARAMSGPPPK